MELYVDNGSRTNLRQKVFGLDVGILIRVGYTETVSNTYDLVFVRTDGHH